MNKRLHWWQINPWKTIGAISVMPPFLYSTNTTTRTHSLMQRRQSLIQIVGSPLLTVTVKQQAGSGGEGAP